MIFAIIILGLLLRLVNLNQSLWLDEAISALAARDFSYSGIIFDFLKADNHPPFYYLLLKFWSSFFGFSEISLRSLSVIFGVLTVYLIYLIVKKIEIRNKKTALLAALFLATSPLHVYYSQEVRMYPVITFLGLLLIYTYLFLLEEKTKIWKFAVFSLLIFLSLATDYVMVFLMPVFLIYPFFKKSDLKFKLRIFLSFIPAFLIFLIWFPYFLIQIEGSKNVLAVLPGWQSVVGGANIKEISLVWIKFVIGRISFENKFFYYFWIMFSSVCFIFSFVFSLKKIKKLILIWLWFLLPLISAFLTSFIIPSFNYFRFIFVLPAFYFLVSLGIVEIDRKLIQKGLIFLIVFINLFGCLIYFIDQKQQREDWKGAVFFVGKNIQKNEIAVFEFPEPFAPFRFYNNLGIKSYGLTDRVFADPVKTSQKTQETIKNKTGIFYFDYLRDLSDPKKIVEKTILDNGFKRSNVYNFSNIGQISYFSKNEK